MITTEPRAAEPVGPRAWEWSVRVHADRTAVFNLLAEAELWPAIFPRIRSCRVLRRDGHRRLISVGAVVAGLPVAWRSVQAVDPDSGTITLRHVSWPTKGTETVWLVTPAADAAAESPAVDVLVRQRLDARRPGVGRMATELARAMLTRLKEIAEGGSLAGRT